jgi:hypothetical protein
MVPDSQGDQLDDNDIEIAGINISMSDEHPSFAGVHYDVDEGRVIMGMQDRRSFDVNDIRQTSTIYPSTIRMPGKFLLSCVTQITRTKGQAAECDGTEDTLCGRDTSAVGGVNDIKRHQSDCERGQTSTPPVP